MFKSLVIYIVEPTMALGQLCEGRKGLWECLSEPMVWTNEEGGQTLMTESQRLVKFKILVFAFLLGEFKSLNTILGNPQLIEETFDQYWNVRRLEPEGTVKELSQHSTEIVQSQFMSTGDEYLDEWIRASYSRRDGLREE